LQAAFLTLGFQNSPITGVWGSRFSHSLRLFQSAYKLQMRARVGHPEWTAIFDPEQIKQVA
jgi:peptidoglycan hydrolase-like protein with peptidoglycan-binding domain